MELVKNLVYAIYDINDDLVGIYDSVEDVVVNYYKVSPNNPIFEIKKSMFIKLFIVQKNSFIDKILKFIVTGIRRNKNGIKILFLIKIISKKYKNNKIISKLESNGYES